MCIFLPLLLIVLLVGFLFVFLHMPSFGRLPGGERLEQIKRSPNYTNGQFRNQHYTRVITSNNTAIKNLWRTLFKREHGLRPQQGEIPVVKSDLIHIPMDEDLWVWFGHSSYFFQVDSIRVLVDPVFYSASPISFFNTPFDSTDAYKPSDIPNIDYLIITHDHWDHLDYRTIKQMQGRISHVICPLGVGAHFEYWGYDVSSIIELDWHEHAKIKDGFIIHCLPARHFSGRGLKRNKALWASFLLETPSQTIFMGGDSGYDTHFADIAQQFPRIDLALVENGQYNTDWRYIHTLPQYLKRVVKDLNAKTTITVHHSKFSMAPHPWYEPLDNEQLLLKDSTIHLIVPQIGEIVPLAQTRVNEGNE